MFPPCCGTLSLRLWWLTMVFCETRVTQDTTNELWWRFYANQYSLHCASCCWELCSKTGLLMMVIITQAVVTLMAIMTPLQILVKVCLKTILAVCSLVNSAGQWVLLFVRRKSNSVLKNLTFEINFWEGMPWALNKSQIWFHKSDFQTFLIIVLETP